MKTKLTNLTLVAAVAICAFSLSPAAFAQGSLTPPGAPAPTMKTLAQVEPRTAIASAPFTISASGSYYLTANLTVSSGNAITLAANGVTLDLNGFTISSTAPSATGYGILINNGLRNLTILNGFIQGSVVHNAGTYSGPSACQPLRRMDVSKEYACAITGVMESLSAADSKSVIAT